jgi:hypothetical protein
MHQALSELLASIQADQSTMANALKSTCQQMGGGSVWVGSAASGWSSQLTGYSSSLSGSINSAVAEVASALAATSATCTQQEARVEDLILSGRLS